MQNTYGSHIWRRQRTANPVVQMGRLAGAKVRSAGTNLFSFLYWMCSAELPPSTPYYEQPVVFWENVCLFEQVSIELVRLRGVLDANEQMLISALKARKSDTSAPAPVPRSPN